MRLSNSRSGFFTAVVYRLGIYLTPMNQGAKLLPVVTLSHSPVAGGSTQLSSREITSRHVSLARIQPGYESVSTRKKRKPQNEGGTYHDLRRQKIDQSGKKYKQSKLVIRVLSAVGRFARLTLLFSSSFSSYLPHTSQPIFHSDANRF